MGLWRAAAACAASCALARPAAGAAPGLEEALRRELQPLVDAESRADGAAFSLGLVAPGAAGGAPSVSLELVAGSADAPDGRSGAPVAAGDMYALGSVAKTFTGAGIMQLVARGVISLDDHAHRYVDPMLQRGGYRFRTMEEIFRPSRHHTGPSPNASNITVRELMHMDSGIKDYDTDSFRDFQYRHSGVDMTPFDVIDWVQGPLTFEPGVPPSGSFNYCSVNFVVLGLVLAYHAGAADWAAFDQSSVVPPRLQRRMRNFTFAKSGPCSSYTRVHGFDATAAGQTRDISNVSCLGGWTAGNALLSAGAAAEWVRALYGPGGEVVPEALVREMLPAAGEFYGLATMGFTGFAGTSVGDYGVAFGHLGDTYGYQSIISYFPKLDMGLAIMTNHEDHLQRGPSALLCTAYNRALDVMLHQPLRNCSYVKERYYFGRCECEGPRRHVDLVV